MSRLAIMIDGGHLRHLAKRAGHNYQPDYIELIAHSCVLEQESLIRVLYYDCAPYKGSAPKPVSNENHEFDRNDRWMQQLAGKDLFAVRKGVLKFRGWVPKHPPLTSTNLNDNDFYPKFEQKGVDMRIGLDFATLSANRAVDRIALISNDTDCIPAMKHARISGLQVALITFPNNNPAQELLWHADFRREVGWP